MSTKVKKIGTKEEVFQGLALHTAGGLLKDDLCQNAKGKIISKAKQAQGQKAYENLKAAREHKKQQKQEQQKAEEKEETAKEQIHISEEEDDDNEEELPPIAVQPPEIKPELGVSGHTRAVKLANQKTAEAKAANDIAGQSIPVNPEANPAYPAILNQVSKRAKKI